MDSCPYCPSQVAETMEHFILECALYDIRLSYITKLEELSGIDVANLPYMLQNQVAVPHQPLTPCDGQRPIHER